MAQFAIFFSLVGSLVTAHSPDDAMMRVLLPGLLILTITIHLHAIRGSFLLAYEYGRQGKSRAAPADTAPWGDSE